MHSGCLSLTMRWGGCYVWGKRGPGLLPRSALKSHCSAPVPLQGYYLKHINPTHCHITAVRMLDDVLFTWMSMYPGPWSCLYWIGWSSWQPQSDRQMFSRRCPPHIEALPEPSPHSAHGAFCGFQLNTQTCTHVHAHTYEHKQKTYTAKVSGTYTHYDFQTHCWKVKINVSSLVSL